MRRSPQEKKALSYAKDRRNDYGENDKSSRKNIPRSRAIAHRSNRHHDDQALRAATGRADDATVEYAEERVSARRRRAFSKWRDAPLADSIEYRLRRRVRLGIADSRSAEARIARIRSRRVR